MTAGVSEYLSRSALLLQAAELFEDSLAANETEQDFAVNHLLTTAEKDGAGVLVGFQTQNGVGRPPPSLEEGLSAALWELQTANLLVAAGLKRRELEAEGAADLLDRAEQDFRTTRSELATASPTEARFEKVLNLNSKTLDAATGAFRTHSGNLLEEIVKEAEETIKDALKGLGKLNVYQVASALSQLGQGLPIVAEAGALVRKGIEKLKRAIEGLAALFGKDGFAKVKEEIGEVWQQANKLGRAMLASVLGVEKVKARIEQILADASLAIASVDSGSNKLAPLAADFARNNKLVRALRRALDLAADFLTLLHFAGPWFGLALGAGYLSTIGGVLLVGGEYTGGRRLLQWVNGVEQIAEQIRSA
jgi:hypothetical protein